MWFKCVWSVATVLNHSQVQIRRGGSFALTFLAVEHHLNEMWKVVINDECAGVLQELSCWHRCKHADKCEDFSVHWYIMGHQTRCKGIYIKKTCREPQKNIFFNIISCTSNCFWKKKLNYKKFTVGTFHLCWIPSFSVCMHCCYWHQRCSKLLPPHLYQQSYNKSSTCNDFVLEDSAEQDSWSMPFT